MIALPCKKKLTVLIKVVLEMKKLNYNMLVWILMCYGSLICSNGCVSAQNAGYYNSSGKFDDKDIKNFVPTFSPQMPEVATPKTERTNSGKAPDSPYSLRIKMLMDSITEANRKVKYIEGFRILVYSGNDKDEADRIKETIYKSWPSADIYTQYKQPTYRIKVGDFANRLQARRAMLVQLKNVFPEALVIPDNIPIKKKY